LEFFLLKSKKQESPVQVFRRHPTEFASLQELLKRLQDRHEKCTQTVAKKAVGDTISAANVSPDTPNVIQSMIHLGKEWLMDHVNTPIHEIL
jgi:hypothetical protein